MTEDSSGAVATRGGAAVGYLLGTPRSDPTWGPNVWVELAGHASDRARGCSRPLCARGGALGRGGTYVALRDRSGKRPRRDRCLVQGRIRPPACSRCPRGASVGGDDIPGRRRRTSGDARRHRRARASSMGSFRRTRRNRPCFSAGNGCLDTRGGTSRVDRRIRRRRRSVHSSQSSTAVSSDRHSAAPPTARAPTVALPGRDGAALLAFAAVDPDARGAGIGQALSQAILGWARSKDYDIIVTDWRMTNLLSSRAWPRAGYRPTFFRLFRAIT